MQSSLYDDVEGTRQIKSLHTLILDKPPCCLEFLPNHRDYFIVGTYNLVKEGEDVSRSQLHYVEAKAKLEVEEVEANNDEDEVEVKDSEKKPQRRDGSLILCKIVDGTIDIIETLDVPSGVLDVHFSPHNTSIFAIATSTGSVACYRVSDKSNSLSLDIEHVATLQASATDVLVTSLSWDPSKNGRTAVTLTSGEVGILTLPQHMLEDMREGDADTPAFTTGLVELETLFTHSLEAWTTIVLPQHWPCSGVLSGGDDAVISFSTLSDSFSDPSDLENASPSPLAYSNRRIHGAGVTAILPHVIHSSISRDEDMYVYISGSYDDNLRVLSAPYTNRVASRQPQVLYEVNLGGGVWRIKLHSETSDKLEAGKRFQITLLVCCMYAGAKIVQLDLITSGEDSESTDPKWTSTVSAEMTEHGSMCYAADMQPQGSQGDEKTTIVSSSFYDQRLCLWQW